MRSAPTAVCIFVLALLAGCDRDSSSNSSAPPPQASRQPKWGVEIERVTPLPPDHRTHLAPTGSGQLFWVQESDPGQRETVFSMIEGSLPAATKFSNTSILEAAGHPDAAGSIQSLATGPDAGLYFYLAGGKRRVSLGVFGVFAPTSGQTRILMDTRRLADESRMAEALSLARGTLLRSGNLLWLWLRHDQGFAVLSIDLTQAGASLRWRFDHVRGPDGQDVRLTAPTEDLSVAGDALIYLDRTSARLWRIDPQGTATPLADVADLPRDLTAPAADPAGRLVLFAPEAATFNEARESANAGGLVLPTTAPAAQWPAWIVFDGQSRTILGRSSLVTSAGLNVRGLSFPRLVRDRAAWLGYDTQTGELLRLRMVERR
ncbi:MAG TPA: hypothetical protein VH475_04030 [Tepidisphaeraceae bacterium]|jgi:hypothetical protein